VNGILNNYGVLDLADERFSLCASLLMEMGAKVSRVGKRSAASGITGRVSLDIEAGRGARRLRHMVESSDILIESFPPGLLSQLKLDYSALSQCNPRLIMASITPFGQTGPYKDFKSSDLVASAMGGQMYVCGDPDKPPLKPFGPQAYNAACLFAANGIMLALWQRHTSNRGQYIDISVHECSAAALDHVLVRYFYEGTVAKREGSLYWNRAFRLFPCRDGYILLSLFYQWETLVEWLDSEGAAADLNDARWLNETERLKNVDHIVEVLERWTRSHTADELVEQGQLMRFPWAKVASIPQVVENPQLNAREFFVEAVDPSSGRRFIKPRLPYTQT
jgi:crotonobetainyl-CoA:carnitine CoA-transferase CaiB-like acyl-CoA transferase